MSVSGDFGRLTGTIAALKSLAKIPAQVASRAAPRIKDILQKGAESGRDPYGKAYAPHTVGTVKRWGPHQLLKLSGAGLGSLDAKPMAGAGVAITADDHMVFTQAGTPTQEARTIMPNNYQLPAPILRVLEEETAAVAAERLKVAK
jgi:hypothetical protein